MKSPKLDAAQALRDLQDRLVPRLALSLIERAIYCHLLRHTRIENRRRITFSMSRLGAAARVSGAGARIAVRSLVNKGALRIASLSKRGHVIEVLLPREVPGCMTELPRRTPDIESMNFYDGRAARAAIYRREEGRCFYCRRLLNPSMRMLDHVVPMAQLLRTGSSHRAHSYRNLVACCAACNFGKGDRPAAFFLRRLYREGHLDREEFKNRLAALKLLARGRLRPAL